MDLSVEMATEATEDAVDGPAKGSFLRKTISKVWGGVPYSGLDENGSGVPMEATNGQQTAAEKAKKKEAEANGKSTCVIS